MLGAVLVTERLDFGELELDDSLTVKDPNKSKFIFRNIVNMIRVLS